MAFTHVITQNVAADGLQVGSSRSYSAGLKISLDENIPDSSTDLQVVLALDVSELKSVFILSDQDMTLETNDGTTPDDTINLLAGVPYIWNTDSYDANKLATDVTAFFMTQSSGSVARLQAEFLYDPTP